jgi:hypothetical protein
MTLSPGLGEACEELAKSMCCSGPEGSNGGNSVVSSRLIRTDAASALAPE